MSTLIFLNISISSSSMEQRLYSSVEIIVEFQNLLTTTLLWGKAIKELESTGMIAKWGEMSMGVIGRQVCESLLFKNSFSKLEE
jgi:hypothetical protein